MVLEAAKGTDMQLYVSTFYQEGGAPEFDTGVKEYINASSEALAANGGNDTISAVTAMGYDAYFVALEAIKAADSGDKAAIMAALPGVTYTGVSGDIAFDDIRATPSATPPTSRRRTPPAARGFWRPSRPAPAADTISNYEPCLAGGASPRQTVVLL